MQKSLHVALLLMLMAATAGFGSATTKILRSELSFPFFLSVSLLWLMLVISYGVRSYFLAGATGVLTGFILIAMCFLLVFGFTAISLVLAPVDDIPTSVSWLLVGVAFISLFSLSRVLKKKKG